MIAKGASNRGLDVSAESALATQDVLKVVMLAQEQISSMLCGSYKPVRPGCSNELLPPVNIISRVLLLASVLADVILG